MALISRFTKAFLGVILALFLLTSLSFIHPPARAYTDPLTGNIFGEGGVEKYFAHGPVHGPTKTPELPVQADLSGGVIMPKLGNATAKAALGQATWKLLHTMTLRFPEHPNQDERDALESYFHLLSRLYPCGECAAEFQLLLKKYPPQTSSRLAAASWLCFVHNEVNKRLKKPEFDCAHLDETYDCGCGDSSTTDAAAMASITGSAVARAPVGGNDGPKDDITGVDMIRGGR